MGCVLIAVSIGLKYWHIYYDISHNVQLKNKKWLGYLVSETGNNNGETKLFGLLKHKLKYGNIKYTFKIAILFCSIIFTLQFGVWLVLLLITNRFTANLVANFMYMTTFITYAIYLGIITKKTPLFNDEIYIKEESNIMKKCILVLMIGSKLRYIDCV